MVGKVTEISATSKVGFEDAIKQLAQRYAKRLEYYAHLAPYNWFNFYDYWPTEPAPNLAPDADDELANATSHDAASR